MCQRQLDGGHLGLRGKKIQSPPPSTEKEPFQLVCYVKIKENTALYCSSSSSGTRDIVFFAFFKMADSGPPSWMSKLQLPPN